MFFSEQIQVHFQSDKSFTVVVAFRHLSENRDAPPKIFSEGFLQATLLPHHGCRPNNLSF
jgi:hypothetical protein